MRKVNRILTRQKINYGVLGWQSRESTKPFANNQHFSPEITTASRSKPMGPSIGVGAFPSDQTLNCPYTSQGARHFAPKALL